MSEHDHEPNERPEADAEIAPEASEAAGETAPEKTVEDLQAELAEMRDHLLRAVADADNTRKRAEKEVADVRQFALTGFARDLLSVADNLSRALSAVSPEVRAGMGEAGAQLLAGVEMTEKELHAVLTRHGVKTIAAAPGERFDPNHHQATAHIPSEHPAGAIAATIQSGWLIGERILRPTLVAVSAGAPAPAAAPASAAGAPDGETPPASQDDGDGAGGAGGAGDASEPGGRVDTKV